MLPIRSVLDAATSARWTGALAASVALHASAALVLAHAPFGSPAGTGTLVSQPLQARLVGPPAPPAPPAAPVRASPEPMSAAAAARATRAPEAANPIPQDVLQPFGVRETPVYYLPSQLDSRPHLLTRVDPAYPQIAPPDGGYVLLRLLIGDGGEVERVLVVGAEPQGVFDAAAVEAFRSARFSPGIRGGIAVRSQVLLEMKFHPLSPTDAAVASGGH
jgi:TonB family protein